MDAFVQHEKQLFLIKIKGSLLWFHLKMVPKVQTTLPSHMLLVGLLRVQATTREHYFYGHFEGPDPLYRAVWFNKQTKDDPYAISLDRNNGQSRTRGFQTPFKLTSKTFMGIRGIFSFQPPDPYRGKTSIRGAL